MGKMKSYMMDQQERFEDLLIQVVGQCNTFEEFVVIGHDLADGYDIDLPDDYVEACIDGIFEEYWTKKRTPLG